MHFYCSWEAGNIIIELAAILLFTWVVCYEQKAPQFWPSPLCSRLIWKITTHSDRKSSWAIEYDRLGLWEQGDDGGARVRQWHDWAFRSHR
jgi:hypothetical protein